MDQVLKNAWLPFEERAVDITVRDGTIHRMDAAGAAPEAHHAADLGGRLVIPGFVDAHTHLDKVLIGDRVVNRSGTLKEAIELMSAYKSSMTRQEVRQRAQEALERSIGNGTRFIRTHVDIDDQIRLASLEALLELKDEYRSHLEIQLVAFPQQGLNDNPRNLRLLEEAVKAGADLIGGIPAQEDDPAEHMRKIFELAAKYDKDIDMHIDETDDPQSLTILDLLDFTERYGYQGRVTADHLCSLAGYTAQELQPLMERIRDARINIISLPSTNLYLQGRGDERRIRRGIAPIRLFLNHGIRVMIGSDNNQDPFNPFGNFDLLEEALITAHGAHLGGTEELEALFDMVTAVPGKNLGFAYSIKEGDTANFIVLDADSKSKAIIRQSGLYGSFTKGDFIRPSDILLQSNAREAKP